MVYPCLRLLELLKTVFTATFKSSLLSALGRTGLTFTGVVIPDSVILKVTRSVAVVRVDEEAGGGLFSCLGSSVVCVTNLRVAATRALVTFGSISSSNNRFASSVCDKRRGSCSEASAETFGIVRAVAEV